MGKKESVQHQGTEGVVLLSYSKLFLPHLGNESIYHYVPLFARMLNHGGIFYGVSVAF